MAGRGSRMLLPVVGERDKFISDHCSHRCPVVKSTLLTRCPLWYWATGLPPSLPPPTCSSICFLYHLPFFTSFTNSLASSSTSLSRYLDTRIEEGAGRYMTLSKGYPLTNSIQGILCLRQGSRMRLGVTAKVGRI